MICLKIISFQYIIPLRRNNALFDRSVLQTGNRSAFDNYFMYNNRVIWYYQKDDDGIKIITFSDSDLENREEKDYICRIESKFEGYTKKKV